MPTPWPHLLVRLTSWFLSPCFHSSPSSTWKSHPALSQEVHISPHHSLSLLTKAASHPYAHLVVEVLNTLYYFAGFVALATFLSKLLFCRGSVCAAARADAVFAAFSWLLWTGSTTILALEIFKGGLSGMRTDRQAKTAMKEAPSTVGPWMPLDKAYAWPGRKDGVEEEYEDFVWEGVEQRERGREALTASLLVHSCVLVRFGRGFFQKRAADSVDWTDCFSTSCKVAIDDELMWKKS